jgi:chaperonin GroEL
MEDMAVLTGGRVFYSVSETSFGGFQISDLGRARRVWATESQFGIFGGKGDPRAVRQHVGQVRGQLERTKQNDAFQKTELQKRVGRLLGGTAILRVNAMTDTETDARKETANRTVTGIRNALREGVLPGGGAALIGAQAVLKRLTAENEDEAVAFKVLSKALEEPLRVIAYNAGFNPDVIIEKVVHAPKGFGLDARNGQIVDMRQCGILDAAGVVQKALEIAVSGAVMMLTTDVIIHHSEPIESIEP